MNNIELLNALTNAFATFAMHGETGKATRMAELVAVVAEREVDAKPKAFAQS